MKKTLFLVLISLMAIGTSQAQSGVVFLRSSFGNITDTVTNTATNTISVQVSQPYKNISVQPVITKLSGTAAGTYYLQGSLDGVNYKSLVGDSVTATNVTTNTAIWVLSTKAYLYYRIGYTGSGTMSATLKGYLFYNSEIR